MGGARSCPRTRCPLALPPPAITKPARTQCVHHWCPPRTRTLPPAPATGAPDPLAAPLPQSLSAFGNGMSGLGLVQPHVKRTSLCDLDASELAPDYTAGLQRVREWVRERTAADGDGMPSAAPPRRARRGIHVRPGAPQLVRASALQLPRHWLASDATATA